MTESNPYHPPSVAPESRHEPSSEAGPRRPSVWRCMLLGAMVAVFASFPLAGFVALVFRFPIPFVGYQSGVEAFLPALLAAFFYGIVGGVVVQAVAGSMGGVAAYMWTRKAEGRTTAKVVLLGMLSALPGLLTLAVLDWIIGPW